MMALWLAAAAALPAEVRALVDRRAQCLHWGGEEPYDRARAREINGAMARLRCDDVDADRARLRRRYARQPGVVRALDAEPEL